MKGRIPVAFETNGTFFVRMAPAFITSFYRFTSEHSGDTPDARLRSKLGSTGFGGV